MTHRQPAEEKEGVAKPGMSGVRLAPWLGLAFALGAMPLAAHDRFFDINRFKVQCAYVVVPVLVILGLIEFMLTRKAQDKETPAAAGDSSRWAARIACGAFLAAACLSAAGRGFSAEVLFGTGGRYAGLLFLLCCGGTFWLVSTLSRWPGRLFAVLRVVAAGIAVLGVLNTLGRDPLGFYRGMRRGDEDLFVSTIGNIDFFGAWLAVMLPLLFGRRPKGALALIVRFVLTFSVCLGLAASRSDGAFAAAALGLMCLLALSGDDLREMAFAFALLSLLFLALQVMYALMPLGKFDTRLSGLSGALAGHGFAAAIAALFAVCCGLCLRRAARGKAAPGRERCVKAFAIALCALALAFCGLVVFFTKIKPEAELGALTNLLRFSDDWGTRRGFVWRRALRAYAGFDGLHKLIGGGVDRGGALLAPYLDKRCMLAFGTFNDAHCQPLQFLLTCGLFGCLSCLALHGIALARLLRHRAAPGLLASVFVYGLLALISPAQPILLMTIAALWGLAASPAALSEDAQ